MTITRILPIIAGCLAVLFVLYNVFKDGEMKKSWVVPALFSLLFFAFSIASIISEGPLGFWPEHTRNMWGTRHSLRSDGRFHFLAILLHRPPGPVFGRNEEAFETSTRASGCNRAVKQGDPKNGERENSAYVSGSKSHFRT